MSCFSRGPAGESACLTSSRNTKARWGRRFRLPIFLQLAILTGVAQAAESPQAALSQWIESIGGQVVRGSDGAIVEVSVARTWATDSDVARIAEIKTIKRLDLGTTYVTDRGIERLQQLPQLEELVLDTDEFLTDGAL